MGKLVSRWPQSSSGASGQSCHSGLSARQSSENIYFLLPKVLNICHDQQRSISGANISHIKNLDRVKINKLIYKKNYREENIKI